MHVDKQAALQQRVIHAAETALAEQNYVSPLDVLTGIGFLAPTHVSSWRNGRIDFLERMIQAHPAKVSFAMSTFHGWAVSKGLRPDETPYLRSTRAGTVDLRFSLSGDPEIE